MNETILNIIETMPFEVYGNKYYKGRHYNHAVNYYQWNYDTNSKHFDYQINIFEYGNILEICAYRNDLVIPIKHMPETLQNTLNNIASYISILGFTIGKVYE